MFERQESPTPKTDDFLVEVEDRRLKSVIIELDEGGIQDQLDRQATPLNCPLAAPLPGPDCRTKTKRQKSESNEENGRKVRQRSEVARRFRKEKRMTPAVKPDGNLQRYDMR